MSWLYEKRVNAVLCTYSFFFYLNISVALPATRVVSEEISVPVRLFTFAGASKVVSKCSINAWSKNVVSNEMPAIISMEYSQ